MGVSVNDCRIYLDESWVQERRLYCTECCEEFDSQDTDGSHTNHTSKMCFEDTYFSLGWGHLEARLQSCLVQVTI